MSSNESHNPYQPSSNVADTDVGKPDSQATVGEFANCPSCGVSNATKISWTFWGGALGPKIFTHVKCNSCRAKYNGKTGAYNTTGIALYLAVSLGIGIAISIAFYAFR